MQFHEKLKAWRGSGLLMALWLFKQVCRPLGLLVFYRTIITYLIKRRGLFERSFYLEVNNDVAQSGLLPLRHYVISGDREGRQPMPLFDPVYYQTQTTDRTAQVNALLHYAYVGRYRKISPSPWFDLHFYLSNNKDIARSNIDPLQHYIHWGGFEGRSPCAQFDASYYLRSNPDVVDMRMNPLLHYLFIGRLEGRHTLPDQAHQSAQLVEQDTVWCPPIDDEVWDSVLPREHQTANIDVIIPVYKGRVETLRCLYSVLTATTQVTFELIVINDASPDDVLTADLQRLAAKGLFTLLSNESNKGFVYTVNRGMAVHLTRDVVLLNADTEVYDGWLDRLAQAAARNPRTGSITPLSNNATICSYPEFLHDNPYPLEISYAELAALTATVNAGIEVETPTGVGFCLYIKRACLEAVGMFDEKTFGKGYGEENDFCQQAIKKGWRNIIIADVFVRHLGAASFQGEKAKRVQAALKILIKRYPFYQKEINAFIDADPLKTARCQLDAARLQYRCRDNNVLVVCHNRGGGSERRMQEEVATLVAQGVGVFTLRPMAKKPTHVVLGQAAIKSLPNINPFLLADTTSLLAALRQLNIVAVYTHSLVDFETHAPEFLAEIVQSLAAKWTINLHDYKVLCPRINLADEHGVYCGEPAEDACNRCLAERGSDFGVVDIQEWRNLHQRALATADSIIVPDQDVAERLLRYLPALRFTVQPHETIDISDARWKNPVIYPDEKLKIVIIGAIGKLKGYQALLACAKRVKQEQLPIEFVVMGYTMNDKLMTEQGVRVTGKYLEHEAVDKLIALAPHAVWLPSLWPETYSYTFSLALRVQCPVFAFDIGALARRAKAKGMTDFIMPLAWLDSPSKIIEQFDAFRLANILPQQPSNLV